jgi:hypothetical protein
MIVAVLLLDRQLEPIAGLDLRVEIDFAAEDLGERQRQVDRFAGGVHRGDERRRVPIDLSHHDLDAARLGNRHEGRGERRVRGGIRPVDAEKAIAVDFVLETADGARQRLREPVRLIDTDLAQFEHGGHLGHDVGRFCGDDLVRVENRRERPARRNARRDGRRIRRQRDIASGRTDGRARGGRRGARDARQAGREHEH